MNMKAINVIRSPNGRIGKIDSSVEGKNHFSKPSTVISLPHRISPRFFVLLLVRKQYTLLSPSIVFQPSAFSLATRPDFISFTSAASSFFIDPVAARSRPSWTGERVFTILRHSHPRHILHRQHGASQVEGIRKKKMVIPLFFATVNRIGTFKRLDQ